MVDRTRAQIKQWGELVDDVFDLDFDEPFFGQTVDPLTKPRMAHTLNALVSVLKYAPDQPRDEHGRWSAGSSDPVNVEAVRAGLVAAAQAHQAHEQSTGNKVPDWQTFYAQHMTEHSALPDGLDARTLLVNAANAHHVYEQNLGHPDADWQTWYAQHIADAIAATRGAKGRKYSADQPRDDHGRWTDGGGGADGAASAIPKNLVEWKQPVDKDGRPIPIDVKSVDEAIPLVLAGKVVNLPDSRSAATLIVRLAEYAKQAERAGQKAKNYDLCSVSVAGTNLFCGSKLRTDEYPNGVPRIAMPQLGGTPIPGTPADGLPRTPWNKDEVDGAKAFTAYLEHTLGIRTNKEIVPAANLKASQAELIGPKVAGIMLAHNFDPSANPIFVSRDNYVIDGHHRWAAVVARDAVNNRLGESKMNIVRIDAPISEVLHIANAWSKKFGIAQAAGVKRAK